MGKVIADVRDARAGVEFMNDATGKWTSTVVLAGEYTPAHVKNGKAIPGCWRGDFFLNDTYGKGEGAESNVIKLTVWNGRNSEPGRGSADKFAKYVSVGRKMSFQAELRPYMGPVFDPATRQQVMGSNGQPLLVEYPGWTYVPGTMSLGEESDKVQAAEMQAYLAAAQSGQQINPLDWSMRPVMNILDPNYAAYLAQWREIMKIRAAAKYTGGQRFGYALVRVPAGAQIINHEDLKNFTGTPVAGTPVAGTPNFGQPIPASTGIPGLAGTTTPPAQTMSGFAAVTNPAMPNLSAGGFGL